jgi:hypothetical protein
VEIELIRKVEISSNRKRENPQGVGKEKSYVVGKAITIIQCG